MQREVSAVGGQQLIVTQSWILMISTYTMHIAHQRDVDLSYDMEGSSK